MTFNVNLTKAQLDDLTQNLGDLAISYQEGHLNVAAPEQATAAQVAVIEREVMDVLVDILPTVNDLPRWNELAAIQAKRRRQAA
jgi:hypothetical protein